MNGTLRCIRNGWLLAAQCAVLSGAVSGADPRIQSVFPPVIAPGKSVEITIRGKDIQTATGLWFPDGDVQVRSLRVESAPEELVRAEVMLSPGTSGDLRKFRIATRIGVSNEWELQVADAPVITEPAGVLREFPALLAGVIARRGEVNSYRVSAQAGQVLSFEARAGARGFDPVLTLAEKSGSWFDSERINVLASNDEPLYFPGLSTDARITHRFAKGGEYLLRVGSFSGQGGPESTYTLRISPGELPAVSLHPRLADAWEERQFTRPVPMPNMAARAIQDGPPSKPESFRAAAEGSAEIPVFAPPGVIEGRITTPGEAHLIRLRIEKAQDLAIEVETPEATMPRFNPVIRLMEPGGQEVVTNVYTKRNNNGLYMMKMIQAKTTFSLAAPGLYTLQIRDITTDRAGADFRYRVLVRPRFPHIGKIACTTDHVNLRPGETKPISIIMDREEEFNGVVSFTAENLPPGVTLLPALEKPPDRPPLPNGGKLERYIASPQSASLLLIAAPGAATTKEPIRVRLLARPIGNGKLREAIPAGEFPMMIVAGEVK